MIEKEFLEEVFSKEWAATLEVSPAMWPNVVAQHARWDLYGEDNCYGAEIHVTGIVVDLLNYRPEICALILIREKSWWDAHQRQGIERATDGSVGSEWKVSYEWSQKVHTVDIGNQAQVFSAMPLETSVMSGVAAFHLGVQTARKILGIQVEDART